VALEHEIETRKLTEQKLAARESELTDFIENASEALHKVDAHGKILWANKAELQMLGYAAEEYLGSNFDPNQIARHPKDGGQLLPWFCFCESVHRIHAYPQNRGSIAITVYLDGTVRWHKLYELGN